MAPPRTTPDPTDPEPEFQGVQEALGQSEAFLQFQEEVSRVAGVDRPVLVVGERGTGKELAATRLHFLSKRWQQPFVALNCAALPASLIESELFGHELGAFTGATARRTGRFESADGGTLFLDEVGLIPVEVQEKILRVVEYGAFERVGSSRSVRVDARIVGATNADLPAMAEVGRFRRDLLDRLSFEVLYVPPLRERREDIMLLANHFAARISHELGRRELPEFGDDAVAALERYAWPGNVRELKNVVERSVYRAETMPVTRIVFDPFRGKRMEGEHGTAAVTAPVRPAESAPARPGDEDEADGLDFTAAVRRVELGMLRKALERARHNQRRAAGLLGLTYHQFRGLFRKYADDLRDEG